MSVDRNRRADSRCAFPSPPGTVFPPLDVASSTATIFIANADTSGPASVVHSGDSAAVYGSGFIPGKGSTGVNLLVGADTAAAGVEVRGDGTFVQRMRVRRGPGILDVSAVQRDGKRVLTDRSSITVIEAEKRK